MTLMHSLVGTVVLLGFFVLAIINLMTFIRGVEYKWQRPASFGVATALLLQYTLGFSLLGEGQSIPASHFLIALTAILPIGFEHGFAGQRDSVKQRGAFTALANLVTFGIVLTAYLIGEMNAG